MKHLNEVWRKWLNETSNPKFLDELEPLLKNFDDLQKSYDGKAPENVPGYAKADYYKQYSWSPSGRRATFTQAPEEEVLEKQLIQLFLKHSDQSYLTSDSMMWAHNLNYKAHAQQAWSGAGLNYPDFKRTDWTKAQGQRQRNVLSCHGFQTEAGGGFYGTGGYGFFVQPTRVLYASKTDLASQTMRTAHTDVKARYTGGTLPKRPGLDRIKSAGDVKDYMKWKKWFRNAVQMLPKEIAGELHAEFMQMSAVLRKDRDLSDPIVMKLSDKVIKAVENFGLKAETPPLVTPTQARVMRDATLLNAEDIAQNKGRVEEALLANWTVKGWYFASDAMNQGPFPANFWRKILPEIVVPIYKIDQFQSDGDQLTEISKHELLRMLS